jgi:hypothetical protein
MIDRKLSQTFEEAKRYIPPLAPGERAQAEEILYWFVEGTGYTVSPLSCRSLACLARGRHVHAFRHGHEPRDLYQHPPGWRDHLMAWNRDGRPRAPSPVSPMGSQTRTRRN